MRRWLWALTTSVVATATAIAVNIATELKQHMWAWIAVGVMTVAGTVVTTLTHRADTKATDRPSAQVNQMAVASDNARIQQAGGDIRPW